MSKSTRSKYEIYKEASLSQKVAYRHREYGEYAGSDPNTSLKIAMINILAKHKFLSLDDPIIMLAKDALNEKRKALFATSERTNEISKLGFLSPKQDSESDWSEDEED